MMRHEENLDSQQTSLRQLNLKKNIFQEKNGDSISAYMGVSKNSGTPKSSILIGLDPLFSPSILGGLPPLFLG